MSEYDYDYEETDSFTYTVSEYIEGKTLKKWIQD